MAIPEIDLDTLEKRKKKNFEERLEFVRFYAQWLKKHRVKIVKVDSEQNEDGLK